MSKDTLRTVIAFGIIIVILIAWQVLFRPKPRPRPVAPAVAQDTVKPPAPDTARPEPPTRHAPVLRADTLARESTLVLENRLLRLEFSTRGAALRSARLKRFSAELVPSGHGLFGIAAIRGLDTLDLSQAVFQSAATESSVTFTLAADSLSVRRTFAFGSGYGVRLSTVLEGASGFRLLAGSGMAITEKDAREDASHSHFYARSGGKVQRLSAKQCKTGQSLARADWVGLKSKYFFTAAVYPDSFVVACPHTLLDSVPNRPKFERVGFSAVVPAQQSDVALYLGPLEYDQLRSYRLGFEEAVSLGWAKPVALAILWLVKALYRVFGNWGVAIIVFSILMKAAFYPLTRTQSRQMRQMQLLQPKLNELKVKFKDNPQALNQETMQLYKLYKINPLSGCLPMVVQLPVFWALYSVLRTFIDLRGAHFVFWLRDLSQPDTLFGHLPGGIPMVGGAAVGLLPVLMGVSFVAQNLLTATDKKNWAMTIIFPVFITAMFLNFPSGLQLYWFMYNVLSIVESLIATRGGPKWLKKLTRKPQPVVSPN